MRIKITNKAKAIKSIKKEITVYINDNLDKCEGHLGHLRIKKDAYTSNREKERAIMELDTLIEKGEILKKIIGKNWHKELVLNDSSLSHFFGVSLLLGYKVCCYP